MRYQALGDSWEWGEICTEKTRKGVREREERALVKDTGLSL